MTRLTWAMGIGMAFAVGGTANAQSLGSRPAGAATVTLGGQGTTAQAATDAADNELTRWGGHYHHHHHGHYHHGYSYYRPHYHYGYSYSYYRPYYGYSYYRPHYYTYSYYRPHYYWRGIAGDSTDAAATVTSLSMTVAEKNDSLKATPTAAVTNLKVSLPAAKPKTADYGFKAYGQK